MLIPALLLAASTSFNSAPVTNYKTLLDDTDVNFYEIEKVAEKQFSEKDKVTKGSGYKGWMRWKINNEYKFYPSGDRSKVDPFFAEKQFQQFQQQSANFVLFGDGWEELGPHTVDSITGHYSAGLGRIEDFYVDPTNSNRVYVGSRSGGFWKTTDGGQTWQGGSTDFLFASGVNAMSVKPNQPNQILINVRNSNNGYSHGVYQSTDGGDNWQPTNFVPANIGFGGLGSTFQVYTIKYHPTIDNLVFIGTNVGMYRSTDNLQTFTRLFGYGGSRVTQIDFHPTDADKVYVYEPGTGRNQIQISNDAGQTFSSSQTILNNNSVGRLSISPDCPNCVYFASTNGVWESINGGQVFTFLSNPDETCHGFAVSDLDTDNMIYGYLNLEGSTDGGQTFQEVAQWSLGNTNGSGSLHDRYFNSTNYVHADLRNAKCINGVFYVATDGHLAKSSDNGTTWEIITEGVGIRENYSLGTSQSNHFRTVCGSQDNGTSIKTEDGWIEFYGADGMEGLFHPLNDQWMLASVQYGGRRRTFNGGASQGGASPQGSSNAYWIAPLAYDPNDHFTIYDFRDRIYKSKDFASTYQALGTPASFSGDIQEAEIAQNNSEIMVISRGSSIDKSIDGGQTFFSIKNGLPNASIQDIAFDPNNDDVIVVVYANYQNDGNKVFITQDGGASWQNITANLGSMPIRSAVIDHTNASNIYLGAEIGVFTKPMDANNWMLYNTDLPNTAVRELEINNGSNTLKAVTWGRGLWEFTLQGRANYPAVLKTSITDQPTYSLPKEGIEQYVTSRIHYDQNLTQVEVLWSIDAPTFDQSIPMSLVAGEEWKSNAPIPHHPHGTKIFFKVRAIGSQQDTTETYKFNYVVQEAVHCNATGNNGAGNLFINRVRLNGLDQASGNDAYTLYDDVVTELETNTDYEVTLNTNTGWGLNDYGVWIDFNHDLNFSEDEFVLNVPNAGRSENSATFQIPNDAAFGDTVRMRTRVTYWIDEAEPCNEHFGEVEDYLILLTGIDTPQLSFTGPKTVCQNEQINFSYTGETVDSAWFIFESGAVIDTVQGTNVQYTPTEAGSYAVTLIAFDRGFNFQLDSLNYLTVHALDTTVDLQVACDSFEWIDGNVYTTSNQTAEFLFQNTNGCDSLIQLDLTIYPSFSSTDVHTSCDSFTWTDGVTYYTSNNTAEQAFTTTNGCDSVVVLDLTILKSTEGTDLQAACNEYTWIDGNTYTESNNTATHVLTNAVGCDSLVTLNLTISNTINSVDEQTACDSFTWTNGVTYTESNNTAQQSLTSAQGCDSLVTLNLTILKSTEGEDIQTACDELTWIDGITYTENNNTAQHSLQNAAGCDSVVTLNLTILKSTEDEDIQTACDEFTWIDGNTYTENNNTAQHTLQNAAGCDSLVTLNLTILRSTEGEDIQTACDEYTWIDGNTYTESNNTVQHVVTNAAGCDSIITLNLTIHESTNVVDVQSACESFTWIDGVTYTESNNTAQHLLQSSVGCDSLVTLNLSINTVYEQTDDVTACNEYTWIDGVTYTESQQGVMYQVDGTEGSCDSIFELNLTILESTEGIDVVSTCEGHYRWIDGNDYYFDNNTAQHVLQNAAGCDSVVTLNLSVHGTTASEDIQTACDSFLWINDSTYTESTGATHTVTNSNGCDSIVYLTLTIIKTDTTIDAQTSCNQFTWIDDITYTESTNEPFMVLTNSSGCDSVVNLHLTIENEQSSVDVIRSCQDITWIDGNTYSTSNFNAQHTLTTQNGCDSVVALNYTRLEPTSRVDIIEACTEFTWIDGIKYTESTAEPIITYVTQQGCDSTIQLDLTIYQPNRGIDEVYACGDYRWIDGVTYTESVVGPQAILTTVNGCDSVVTLNLTIEPLVASLIQQQDTFLAVPGRSFFNYQWLSCTSNGLEPIVGANTEKLWVTDSSGIYAVVISNENCADTSRCEVYQIVVNNIETAIFNDVQVYPVPFTSTLHINRLPQGSTVQVFDAQGAMVYVLRNSATEISIPTEKWNNGVYQIVLQHKETMQTIRAVK